jgi:hypothetical protein
MQRVLEAMKVKMISTPASLKAERVHFLAFVAVSRNHNRHRPARPGDPVFQRRQCLDP